MDRSRYTEYDIKIDRFTWRIGALGISQYLGTDRIFHGAGKWMEIHHAVSIVRWRDAHTEQTVGPLKRNSRHVEFLALKNWKKK